MARGKADNQTGRLFRSASGQTQLFEKSYEEELEAIRGQRVECLGLTFENDDARKVHFLGKLKEGLEELHGKLEGVPFTSVDDAAARLAAIETWPMGDEARLRKLADRMRQAEASKDLLQRWKDEVGFPLGDIEDILEISDPPYYTACPNPFLREFIAQVSHPYEPNELYRREPFASDVSEGKTDIIYTAHPYHTKVPYRAIMHYIAHYTDPGDVVLDGFCGTGMTAVAAHACVHSDHNPGRRHAVLCDLAPAATFIAYNYAHQVNPAHFADAMQSALTEVDSELGWMYRTVDPATGEEAQVDFYVWSDVFICPECSEEILYLSAKEDADDSGNSIECPSCSSSLSRRDLVRAYETRIDESIGKLTRTIKRSLERIQYVHRGQRKIKNADEYDFQVLARIEGTPLPENVPSFPMMFREGKWGDEWRRGRHEHITHVHHFYKKRPLLFMSRLWKQAESIEDKRIRHAVQFAIGSLSLSFTDMNRYAPKHFSQVNRFMSGVLYIGAVQSEPSPQYCFKGKIPRLKNALEKCEPGQSLITTESATQIDIPENSIDYVFVDPPFGQNLHYSELNFLWEAWFRVFTHAPSDAVISEALKRDIFEYQDVMQQAFASFQRALKPGRWITVEFHNSRNAVWNTIQEALTSAGFIVADVRTLDKKQGTFKQVMAAGAVKRDLIISAYKPNRGLEERFKLEAGTEDGVWDFVRTHLGQLPVFVSKDGQAETIAERQNFLLFDRMVAFHVQRGVTVPMSAVEFYAGLVQRFPERDGMYFLPDHVAEYDKKRMSVKEVLQLEIFVIDESSAIQWLKQQLIGKPQTFQDVHPQFLREIGGWQKHERALELSELLEQNFLRYDGTGEVPSQIHSYLSTNFKELRNLPKDNPSLRAKAKDRWYVPDPNKAGDLERLRERALLREFEEYRQSTQKRLKVFRLEAVRAGFKRAWQDRDYETIIAVARKVPEDVLQEDPKLLMWYDQALTRTEAA